MQDREVATTTTLERTAVIGHDEAVTAPEEPRTGSPAWVRHTVAIAVTAMTASLLTMIVIGTGDGPNQLPDAVADLRAAVTAGASLVSCFEGVHDEIEGQLDAGGGIAAHPAQVASTRLGGCDATALTARIDQVPPLPSTPLGSRDQLQLSAAFEDATDALRATVDAAATARDAYTRQLEARAPSDTEAERALAELDARHDEASSLLFQLEHAVAELHPPRLAPELTSAGQG